MCLCAYMCKIQRMIYDLFKFIFSVQTLVHLLGEPLTEIAHPSQATGSLGKGRGINKLPPTGRNQERLERRCQSLCPANLRESFSLESILTKWCVCHQEDPGSECLARDKLESNPITIKANISSHVAEQFSWVPLSCCSPPRLPFPIKSLALSACVSLGNSFTSVRQEPTLRPGRGPLPAAFSLLESFTKQMFIEPLQVTPGTIYPTGNTTSNKTHQGSAFMQLRFQGLRSSVVCGLPRWHSQCRSHRYAGSIPGLGRSPGRGNSNRLQYSCLESPMDRGAWWAPVQGAA